MSSMAALVPVGAALRRRAMGLTDLETVLAVERCAYRHPWSPGNFADSLQAGYLCELLETRRGELVGYFVAMTGVDELHLLNITVAVPWQGRGQGGALLAAVVAHARSLGLGSLWLEVRAGNRRAHGFYLQRGFAEVGMRRGYYPGDAGREDAVVMRLDLARAGHGGAPGTAP